MNRKRGVLRPAAAWFAWLFIAMFLFMFLHECGHGFGSRLEGSRVSPGFNRVGEPGKRPGDPDFRANQTVSGTLNAGGVLGPLVNWLDAVLAGTPSGQAGNGCGDVLAVNLKIPGSGAIKLHILLDLRGSILSSIKIIDMKVHDVRILDDLIPEPGCFYIFDCAYHHFSRPKYIHQNRALFIIRAKPKLRCIKT